MNDLNMIRWLLADPLLANPEALSFATLQVRSDPVRVRRSRRSTVDQSEPSEAQEACTPKDNFELTPETDIVHSKAKSGTTGRSI
jgi:hypothetical protein